MKFEWDEAKRQANFAKHGLDFADADTFDWLAAIRWRDDRKAYGETRFAALGLCHGRVHSVAFAMRGNACRLISFRRANDREAKRYEEEKARS